MAQPGRQQGQAGLNVAAVVVPVQQGGGRKRVAQVVQARAALPGPDTDPGGLDQAGEGVREVVGVQPGAAGRDEERGRAGGGAQPLAGLGVATQSGDGACVQGDLAGLAELGIPDGEHAIVEVDIGAVQPAGLAGAHAGHRQQAQQCPPGQRPKRRPQRIRRGQQRGDLVRRIQMRGDAPVVVGQEVGGWNLGGRVQHLEVPGEAAHHHQPTAPVHLVGAARRAGRPGQRSVGGDVAGALLFEVADEATQPLAERGQLEPEPATHRQVGFGVLAD